MHPCHHVFRWMPSTMLLKENAVYKHPCVRCYQLCSIPRNSLIPNTQSLLTHFKKCETLREKKKQPCPLAKEFCIFLGFENIQWWRPQPPLLEPTRGENASLDIHLNLLLQFRPSVSSSHVCQREALSSVLSGSSVQALGSLSWALLKPPPLLQPSTSLVPQPEQLCDTNLNSLRFPAPNLHQDHYKLPRQSRSEILLDIGPRSDATMQVKMGGYRDWLTLSSFVLNLTVPSSCHPLWRPYLLGPSLTCTASKQNLCSFQ